MFNENLDESSVEEGNEDLKSKIPELTSKKFIRDSGVSKDSIWIVPYLSSTPIKMQLSKAIAYPIRDVKVYKNIFLILDRKRV